MRLGRQALWFGAFCAALAGVGCRPDQVQECGRLTFENLWRNQNLRDRFEVQVAEQIDHLMESNLRDREFIVDSDAGWDIARVTVRSVDTVISLGACPQVYIDPTYYRSTVVGSELHLRGSFTLTLPQLRYPIHSGIDEPSFHVQTRVHTNESGRFDEEERAAYIFGQMNGTFDLYIETATQNVSRASFEVLSARLRYSAGVWTADTFARSSSSHRIRGMESIHRDALIRGLSTTLTTTLSDSVVAWF